MKRAVVRLCLAWAVLLAMTLVVYEGWAGGHGIRVFYVLLIGLALVKASVVLLEYMEISKISQKWVWFYTALFAVILIAFSVLHQLAANAA